MKIIERMTSEAGAALQREASGRIGSLVRTAQKTDSGMRLQREQDWEIALQLASRDAEIARLRASLTDLYNWVSNLPVKHPQQAEQRDRAVELLGIKGR